MSLNAAFTLMLGLVFQLAQVTPGADHPTSCQMAGDSSCSCCESGDSCPCATNGDPSEPQSPAVPVRGAPVQKLAPAGLIDTEVAGEPIRGVPEPCRLAPGLRMIRPGGYTGVCLAVAFCRWVI